MENRHAFLIIAHNEPEILNRLLMLLDDPRNCIFVHYDKKCTMPEPVKLRHAELHTFSKVKVYWGDYSQIECEMALFEKAYQHGPFEYYHLLSGVDLPIKSNDEIHSFFDSNKGKEFVSCTKESLSTNLLFRVHYYHIGKSRHKTLLKKAGIAIQKALAICRNKNTIFRKGGNWVSITHSFTGYLLSKKKEIRHTFHHTYCADEMFLQTILWNSRYKNNIYKLDNENIGCMRDIDWTRGEPYVWGADKNDFNLLKNSAALFARKFSSRQKWIIDEIFEYVKAKNIQNASTQDTCNK